MHYVLKMTTRGGTGGGGQREGRLSMYLHSFAMHVDSFSSRSLNTALDIAAREGHAEAVRILLAAGAHVEKVSSRLTSPLESGSTDVPTRPLGTPRAFHAEWLDPASRGG